LKIHEELDDRVNMGRDYSNIGNVLGNTGKYQEAVDSHNKALKIHEELNDRVNMGQDYSGIGIVLRNIDKPQEALDSFKKALKIHEELNDRLWLPIDYVNIRYISKTGKGEASKDLYNALTIIQQLARENGYRHPLMDEVNNRISDLKA
jgi:tetratricopeptide (TPR) repeat protein